MQKHYLAVLDISNDNYLIPESLGIQDFPTFKMYDHERLKPAKASNIKMDKLQLQDINLCSMGKETCWD